MRTNSLLFILLVIFSALRVPGLASAETTLDKAQATFTRKCGQCHAPERAEQKAKTNIAWDKTVDWMRQKQNADFTRKQARTIKKYLQKNSADYGRYLFENRCASCHGLEKTQSLRLAPEQWQQLVKRERSRAVFWIGVDEADQISKYLTATYPGQEPADKKRRAQEKLSAEKCLRCHTYETVFKTEKTAQEWQTINLRMREKSPQWISLPQLKSITEFLCQRKPRQDH